MRAPCASRALGPAGSEMLLPRALAGCYEPVCLATQFFYVWVSLARAPSSEGSYIIFMSPGFAMPHSICDFAICLNPSKDSRPRRTPGTACACPPSRASASGHLSVSTCPPLSVSGIAAHTPATIFRGPLISFICDSKQK